MDNYERIIGDDTAKVISTSWGECETKAGAAAAQSENTLFEEAATQGRRSSPPSGDSGAHDCTPDSPARP